MGFELDFWDYITFVTLFLMVVAGVMAWVWLAGLPGRIALQRKHPDAEAVLALGWAGLLPTVYPWMQALIWAFKPADIVDIRRFPREEARAVDEQLRRLGGTPARPATPAEPGSPHPPDSPNPANPPAAPATDH
jgi:hypothetical protein